MKRFLVVLLVCLLCAGTAFADVAAVIREAQKLSLPELFQKAIEESNGKRFDAVGNSSRGKSVLPLFVAALQKSTLTTPLITRADGSSRKRIRFSTSSQRTLMELTM